MKRKSYLERIRAALFLAIKRTAANLDTCVKVPGKDFFKNKKTTVTSYAINALGDIPYDELEELLNRDRSQLHRWNKASEMREHRPKRLGHCKIPHDELGTYVAAHQGLFDSSLPIFAAASSIIEREFSVMLIVQRKYVVDYE